MKLIATGDLHGELPKIPECDLLLVCGDLGPWWDHSDVVHRNWFKTKFYPWVKEVPARKIIAIGGNHDFFLEKPGGKNLIRAMRVDTPLTYLENEATEFEGLRIWGTPYVPHLRSWAFYGDEHEKLLDMYQKIPSNTDILISHGPPLGINDNTSITHVGSWALRDEIGKRPDLKLHVHGHIHECYGHTKLPGRDTLFVSCSHMDRNYDPVNKPIEIEWDGKTMEVIDADASCNDGTAR
jgi:Icc-related predicted phosphoesterase